MQRFRNLSELILSIETIGLTGLLVTIILFLAFSVSAAELPDWRAARPLPARRFAAGAVTLPSGNVLVVGGLSVNSNGQGELLTAAALYTPATGLWREVAPLPRAHCFTAVLLKTGEAMVVGDDALDAPAPSAFLFNEKTGQWVEAAPPWKKRYAPTVTVLASGDVLLAGGHEGDGYNTFSSVELYSRRLNVWLLRSALPARFPAPASMKTARMLHTATLLPSGKVLVVGGAQGDQFMPLREVEIYDPATGTWKEAAPLAWPRYAHTATLLKSGKVLVVGGFTQKNSALASAELYDPEFDTWTLLGAPGVARARHTATLLPSGQVLLAGGEQAAAPLNAVEYYDPANGVWARADALRTARTQHCALLLGTDDVLVVGGLGADNRDVASAELFGLSRGAERRPSITPPPGLTAVTARPGDRDVAVSYPSPVVTGISVASFVCAPAPGARFTVGAHTITCDVKGRGGELLSTSFNLTVWDVCLSDEQTGDTLLFNTATGAYQFTRCGVEGAVLRGHGKVVLIEERLKLESEDVVAEIGAGFRLDKQVTGTATIQLRGQQSASVKIADNNILDNKGVCRR